MRIILSSPGLRTPDGVKHTYEIGTPEYDWLSTTIDDAHAAGLKWVVSAMHYPCFSIGVYSCVMGRDTMDLLVSKKVDLVLMGHEHNYSRTYQLGYGTGCEDRTILKPSSFKAACIRDSDSAMVKGAGTVFAIVGTGGTTLRDLDTTDPEAPYFAAASGLTPDARIVPFRGEYFELAPEKHYLVRGLIYPVPDPRFPFLGVHLTRMVRGGVHAGPNAVLALRREGYTWRDVDPTELRESLAWPGLWALAKRNVVPGAREVMRSLSKRQFAASLSRLVPGIEAADRPVRALVWPSGWS